MEHLGGGDVLRYVHKGKSSYLSVKYPFCAVTVMRVGAAEAEGRRRQRRGSINILLHEIAVIESASI
jgi:hypothetical protein